MSKFCPILNEKVTYMFCEDCEDKLCKTSSKNRYLIDEFHTIRPSKLAIDTIKGYEERQKSVQL
jgi:hypothetical protein